MDFKNKIKTIEEVKELTAGKSVIMCHGTFDLVHPGHIRHLLYAKSKADILVASITCDSHIIKGNTRPYVPQELRATNLAVLNMVDYVVVDDDPTPLKNISYLKPNYFAKGYEYDIQPNSKLKTIKTKEEKDLVESYGGQIIFTPGDVVYSSTTILNATPPKLGIEKLLTLMQSHDITFDSLRNILEDIKGTKVHIIGDTIVDSYTYANVIGGMTKTPTMSVKYDRCEDFIGGAAIVALHLKAAGADVDFTTIIGNDHFTTFVQHELEKIGVRIKAMTDGRVTTNKNVIIAGGYRLLKIDRVENRTLGEDALEKIIKRISSIPTEMIIFSDFRHGIFNSHSIPLLTHAIPKGIFKAADSQVASRWGNILDFYGFDLITPNEREARFALGDQDSTIRPLATRLYNEAACKFLILKCAEAGTFTIRSIDTTDFRAAFALDSFCNHPVDPVGAGDALLAYSSLALKKGHGAVSASILGGIAAGLECEHDGNIPITSEKVLEQIDKLEKIANYESR